MINVLVGATYNEAHWLLVVFGTLLLKYRYNWRRNIGSLIIAVEKSFRIFLIKFQNIVIPD